MRLRILSTRDDDEIVCLFVLSLSLSLSLSKVVTEQSAQNVMIFSPKKKKEQNDKRENFFNDTKKCHVCCFFSSFAVPLTTRIRMYSQHTTNNTNETEERNESKNDEKEYLFCTRACVCAETVLCYSFHKQGRILLRGFSRFARMS